MTYQIETHVAKQLQDFFSKFDFIDKVVVFGSRARHDANPKSDIDLCIYSLEMTSKEFTKLKIELDELPILYKMDVVHFEKSNDALKENILRDEKLFYIPTKTIKEIGKVITGKTPPTKENKYWNSPDIPFVKPDDFKNDVTVQNKYNTYISFDGLTKTNEIPANSVLVTCIGTIGKVIINNTEVATNQQINAIVPNDNIDSKYLMYQIFTKRKYLNHIANAPVVPIINKTAFEKVKLIKPSLTKQKQIVKTLDKVQELIELRKESIKKLDALSKSIFIDMFGDSALNPMRWDVSKLEDVTTKITDGTHKTPLYKDSGIIFISAKNIKNETITFKDCKYISKEEHTQLTKRCNPEYEDILLTKSGSTGMSTLVPKVDFEFSLFESLCLIKFNKKLINPYFLKFLLNSEGIKFQYSKFIKGVAVKHLHLQDIRKLTIIIPPNKNQINFTNKIKKIEQQKALYEEQLKKLQENFDALLAQSFQA